MKGSRLSDATELKPPAWGVRAYTSCRVGATIDTNVFISSELGRQDLVEDVTRQILELAQVAAGVHMLMVHPTVSDGVAIDRDEGRRQLRDLVRARYPTLESPPAVQPWVEAELGRPAPGSHNWYDHQLLVCVTGDAVHGLITQDDRIHRKARRLQFAGRVHTVADALSMLSQLADRLPASSRAWSSGPCTQST